MRRFEHILMHMHATTGPGRWIGHPDEMTWQPLVDVYEGSGGITIIAEIPGVDEGQVHVTVERNTLNINGFREKQIPGGAEYMHQMEIPYGRFSRAIELAPWADLDHIEAEHRRGYLTINVPRNTSP